MMVFGKDQTGGSVPGHLPTNPNGNREPLDAARAPGGGAYAYRFGQPLGDVARRKGSMGRVKNKERQCLEAIQNQTGKQSEEAELKRLTDRFPHGMVRRLKALQAVCEDPDHPAFIHAQRLAREILTTQKKGKDDPEDGDGASAPTSGDTIEVIQCRISVPMPGAGDAEPGAAHASLHEPPGTQGGG
jgi:hypothetical protein